MIALISGFRDFVAIRCLAPRRGFNEDRHHRQGVGIGSVSDHRHWLVGGCSMDDAASDFIRDAACDRSGKAQRKVLENMTSTTQNCLSITIS